MAELARKKEKSSGSRKTAETEDKVAAPNESQVACWWASGASMPVPVSVLVQGV